MSEQKPVEAISPQTAVSGDGDTARPRSSRLAVFALLFAAGAAALSAWQWYDWRTQRSQLEHELGRKLSEIDGVAREARDFSTQSRSSLRDAEVRIGQLEARIVETQNQRFALETLYREMSRNRDELILAEVEQILLIASQQLQLAGNLVHARPRRRELRGMLLLAQARFLLLQAGLGHALAQRLELLLGGVPLLVDSLQRALHALERIARARQRLLAFRARRQRQVQALPDRCLVETLGFPLPCRKRRLEPLSTFRNDFN